MSKKLNIAQRIRALKIGQHFTVDSEQDQRLACKEARTLRRAGVIEFQVVTRKDGLVWKVAAI